MFKQRNTPSANFSNFPLIQKHQSQVVADTFPALPWVPSTTAGGGPFGSATSVTLTLPDFCPAAAPNSTSFSSLASVASAWVLAAAAGAAAGVCTEMPRGAAGLHVDPTRLMDISLHRPMPIRWRLNHMNLFLVLCKFLLESKWRYLTCASMSMQAHIYAYTRVVAQVGTPLGFWPKTRPKSCQKQSITLGLDFGPFWSILFVQIPNLTLFLNDDYKS